MKNTELVENYRSYLLDECGASENTTLSYCRDIRQFAAFCASKGVLLDSASESMIDEFILNCEEQRNADSSIARKVSSLKSFYTFAYVKHNISENPAESVKNIKIKHKTPEVLTYTEVTKLLELPETKTLRGIRDRAALELLYATGMRVSEIVGLDISDVNLSAGSITCGGTKNQRQIPLYPASVKALDKYINTARNDILTEDSEKALILNMSGARITRQGFWKIIKYYQLKSGIGKDITPHMLRHSFGAELIRNGADIYTVQELMGHKDIISTKVYCDMLNSDIKRVYNKAHPRA